LQRFSAGGMGVALMAEQLLRVIGQSELFAGLDPVLLCKTAAALPRWQSFDPQLFNYLKSDPFLTSLHGEAEFWQIVAEVETELAKIRQQVRAARSG